MSERNLAVTPEAIRASYVTKIPLQHVITGPVLPHDGKVSTSDLLQSQTRVYQLGHPDTLGFAGLDRLRTTARLTEALEPVIVERLFMGHAVILPATRPMVDVLEAAARAACQGHSYLNAIVAGANECRVRDPRAIVGALRLADQLKVDKAEQDGESLHVAFLYAVAIVLAQCEGARS